MEILEKIQELEHKLDVVLLILKASSTSKSKAMLDTDEAATYLGISISTLYKHTSAGNLSYYKPNGKLLLFRREDLDAWIASKRIPSTKELSQL